ncbi:hypothetical protein [Niveispirillum sp. KHB5.9]|uniref:hypothetical protein n=1 Tax=Niveispirillum sp. KHB5.9 TaxID=3400269 RepID=UPI003A8B54C7
MRFTHRTGLLLAVCLANLPPAMAQQDGAPSMSAAEKAQKQAANEEAERLCKRIQDPDKFNECLDLYFLDAGKFKAFLEANGVAKPDKPAQ